MRGRTKTAIRDGKEECFVSFQLDLLTQCDVLFDSLVSTSIRQPVFNMSNSRASNESSSFI